MRLEVATFVMASAAALGSGVRIYQNSRSYALMKKMAKRAKKRKKK